MNTRISTFTLNGQRYAVVPLELLEQHSPELLKQGISTPRVPEGDAAPWEVVRRSINEDISMMRAWREYLGLAQEEVASRMGISQSALSQIERQTRPRQATLRKVAAALDISVEQLRG